MSSNSYSAGAGAILAGADASATARNEVQSSISAVDSSAQAVRGGWESPASRAMLETVARWRESAEGVNNELNNFEANLRSTQTDYNAAEDEHQSTFQGITSRMG